MYRIILVMAVTCTAMMVLTVGMGLDLWGALDHATALGEARNVAHFGVPFSRHFSAGLFTAILVLATHSLVLIYFIGVGRAIKEASARLPGRGGYYAKKVRSFHARSSPFLTLAMLLFIATAVMGMDSYKGFLGGSPRRWVHLALALVTIPFNLFAFRQEYRTLKDCSGLLDELDAELEKKVNAEHAENAEKSKRG